MTTTASRIELLTFDHDTGMWRNLDYPGAFQGWYPDRETARQWAGKTSPGRYKIRERGQRDEEFVVNPPKPKKWLL